MPTTFDRDAMAVQYAKRHVAADPAILSIHYLPTDAPANEIRLVEVNGAIRSVAAPEPVDFGVAAGSDNEHKLIVVDVTPEQWRESQAGKLELPPGWTLKDSQQVGKGRLSKRR